MNKLEVLQDRADGELCLEVGCGQEDLSASMEKKGYYWIGLDSRLRPKITVRGDAHHLPFRNDCIDKILCFKVLEHLRNPFQALREASRVLKKGGYIIGSVAFLEPYHNSYYHFTHIGIRTALEQAGFKIDEISAGWDIFESIAVMAMMAHPDSYKGKILKYPMHICYKLFLSLRRRLTSFYCKYIDGCGTGGDLRSVFQDDDLRFAGEVRFVSQLREKYAETLS